MPGCGYICPKCNDSGFDENQKACDWCRPETPKNVSKEISTDEWIKAVHESPCCGDLGQGKISE
jgi:hypothetical protein